MLATKAGIAIIHKLTASIDGVADLFIRIFGGFIVISFNY
jgi:hypothetical protein